jgi:SOS response regulatory protein OraA/RecX
MTHIHVHVMSNLNPRVCTRQASSSLWRAKPTPSRDGVGRQFRTTIAPPLRSAPLSDDEKKVNMLRNLTLDGPKYVSTKAFEPSDVDKAKAQVIRFLEYKPRTRRELFDKLTVDKGYDAEDANEALDQLRASGVQNDAEYAEMFARYKWRNSRWAAWRVRGALRQKGVEDRDIDEGFASVFARGGVMKVDMFADEDADEEEDLMDDEVDLERERAMELLQAARTQFKRNTRGDMQARIRRLMAWLERRGHGGSVIRDIVEVIKREEKYADDDDEDDNALHFD